VAASERPATPLWWYALVGFAILLVALWVVNVVVGFFLGLVKVAILVILAVALVRWVLVSKAER
jgi:energy-coupling factor transporter transmembrane protein EcfT